MNTIQKTPTIEEVLNYEEILLEAVGKQVGVEMNPEAKEVLLRLQVLLKERSVKQFIDLLSIKRFSISAIRKIQEIDDAFDKLMAMRMPLPYPDQYFFLEKRKAQRARQYTMLTLLFGLFGFEWVN